MQYLFKTNLHKYFSNYTHIHAHARAYVHMENVIVWQPQQFCPLLMHNPILGRNRLSFIVQNETRPTDCSKITVKLRHIGVEINPNNKNNPPLPLNRDRERERENGESRGRA